MRRRVVHLGGCVLMFLTMFAVPAQQVDAGQETPRCFNPRTNETVAATKWLTSPGTLVGTSRADVLVGSTGADVIKGLSGNDVICTSPAGTGDLDVDVVDGGPGNDSIYGISLSNGGPGDDFLMVWWTGSVAQGGPGSDRIIADSDSVGDGGSGNDIVAGRFARELYGGSGNDWVGNVVGNPLMDCGVATDRYASEGVTTVRRCENEVSVCEFYWIYDVQLSSVESADFSAAC